jgi:hypothetical protein
MFCRVPPHVTPDSLAIRQNKDQISVLRGLNILQIRVTINRPVPHISDFKGVAFDVQSKCDHSNRFERKESQEASRSDR